eukprot:jgi/Tetstr1/426079/TSEL_016410.t1
MTGRGSAVGVSVDVSRRRSTQLMRPEVRTVARGVNDELRNDQKAAGKSVPVHSHTVHLSLQPRWGSKETARRQSVAERPSRPTRRSSPTNVVGVPSETLLEVTTPASNSDAARRSQA